MQTILKAALIAAILTAGWGIFPPAAPAAEPAAKAAEPAAEDEWQDLPPGPGREDVFYICQACHSLAIVKQQGLDRASWNEVLAWMVKEQGMDPLEEKQRNLVLDYLATHYGRK